MAIATTTNPADFTYRRVTYLNKKMLETLKYQLRFEQFADKKSFPAAGTLSVRFFRAAKAQRTSQVLQEGVQNKNSTTVGVGHVDCFLIQIGDDFQLSDIVSATDVLDTLKIYTETVGGTNAALDYDGVIQASILGNATNAALATALKLGAAQTTLYNANAQYGIGYFERFAGIANSGNDANDWNSLNALSAAEGKITRLENMRAITQLRVNDIMPPDGQFYPALVPPQVMYDIRQDATLVGAMQYRDNQKLYKWEEFTLDGAAFIEHTNPWRENAYGTNVGPAAGNVFALVYLGSDAFGTVMIDDKRAGGSPAAPKLTILDEPDKSDIYNQTIAGAWKAYYGSILKLTSDASDVPHCVALRCKSTFV